MKIGGVKPSVREKVILHLKFLFNSP